MQAVITRPVHGAHRDQVRGADPTGLCTDPGGPGARYCIDAFIAQGVTNFGFKTDDHVGPKSDGGTYRFELTFRREQNGNVSYEAKRGTSVLDFLGVHLEEPAEIIRCDAMGGSSSIVAGCIAGDGIGGGLAPKVGFILVINDSGTDASLVRGTYTSFPSLEVWRYQDNQDPELMLFNDASNSTIVGFSWQTFNNRSGGGGRGRLS